MLSHAHTYTHACTRTYIARTGIHTHAYTHLHTCTCTHTHTMYFTFYIMNFKLFFHCLVFRSRATSHASEASLQLPPITTPMFGQQMLSYSILQGLRWKVSVSTTWPTNLLLLTTTSITTTSSSFYSIDLKYNYVLMYILKRPKYYLWYSVMSTIKLFKYNFRPTLHCLIHGMPAKEILELSHIVW